jgi:hypothetical protein
MEAQVVSKNKRDRGGTESINGDKLSGRVKKVMGWRNMNDMKASLP